MLFQPITVGIRRCASADRDWLKELNRFMAVLAFCFG